MTAAAPRALEQARLHADVARAGAMLPEAWPLETFIAVNPLGGFEERPFADAIGEAGRLLGARGTLPEEQYREAYGGGRITEDDLRDALRRAVPQLAGTPPVVLGERTLTGLELLMADALHGEPAPRPVRRVRTLAERAGEELAGLIDAQTGKWCAAFLDQGQAGWPMPGREHGFYAAWRRLAAKDTTLPRPVRSALAGLPESAEDAVLAALAALGIGDGRRVAYCQAHFARLPGWSAHVRWRSEHGGGIDLTALLAMRLSYEAALLHGRPRPAEDPPPATLAGPGSMRRARRVADALGVQASEQQIEEAAGVLDLLPADRRGLVWLDAYERHYRDRLLAGLDAAAEAGPERPAAQVVCCIDARSEGLRRHLERLGSYETLGFAGFFAVAIRYQDLAGGRPTALCPVLLEPRNEVRERAVPGAEEQAAQQLARRRALHAAETGFHEAKEDAVAPFALAEGAGWVAGPLAAMKTFAAGRYGALREQLHERAVPAAPTVLGVQEAFTLQERELFAEVALRMMGLTGPFAELVVLCGHGSSTENNPYAAALDCGACGGNAGGPNARTAAAILNGADVRAALAARGIEIPEDTWFAAAEHDTTRDEITLLDEHLIPESHHDAWQRLATDLQMAGALLAAERAATLPGGPAGLGPDAAARHARARSTDWAQVFPEWGLAGNAAFIVAPRSVTAGSDLERRCFLHSYDPDADPDGSALETILTAPLVVAQWINCQYYFSTVDPLVFGAGTKTIHNVVGGVGVLAGHNGDLQLGLPWQSVADGERLVHEPMRLLAVVQAPRERLDEIIVRNPILRHLFGGGWVALVTRERPGEPWQRYTAGGWSAWTEEEVMAR